MEEHSAPAEIARPSPIGDDVADDLRPSTGKHKGGESRGPDSLGALSLLEAVDGLDRALCRVGRFGERLSDVVRHRALVRAKMSRRCLQLEICPTFASISSLAVVLLVPPGQAVLRFGIVCDESVTPGPQPFTSPRGEKLAPTKGVSLS